MLATKARVTEALFNFAAICLILAVIAAIDADVRRHVGNALAGNFTAELGIIAVPANRLTRAVFETLGDQSLANGPLLAFGAVALVLLGLMLRS